MISCDLRDDSPDYLRIAVKLLLVKKKNLWKIIEKNNFIKLEFSFFRGKLEIGMNLFLI